MATKDRPQTKGSDDQYEALRRSLSTQLCLAPRLAAAFHHPPFLTTIGR